MTPEEKLLSQLLRRQIGTEIEDTPAASAEWEAWYVSGKPMSPAARQQLWFSPAHRAAYTKARSAHIDAASKTLREQGYFATDLRLAADSETNHEELIGPGYKLSMTRSDSDDWFLLLELEASLLSTLGPTAMWTLKDDGGMVWIEGDAADGILERLWDKKDETPIQRLRQYGVTLVPN